jgi:glycosyltransferase involved in cell wall biosynthesis
MLLEAHGHDVRFYGVSNTEVRRLWDRVTAAVQVPYAPGARARLAREIDRVRPDVVHVHNFFPLLSPSVYDACRAAGVSVVQTLHNYRLLCLNAVLFRDGHSCEDCVGKSVPWPGVIHGCYLGSRLASGTVAAMLVLHRILKTWAGKVDVFITPSEYARRQLVVGGLPAGKLTVKPNFVHPDPGTGAHAGGYVLYVGRLSREKGVETLLAAWEILGARVPLKIVGEGPLDAAVARAASPASGISWEGPQPPERTLRLMQDARALIFPSLLVEVLPTVVVEAFATGLPVIAATGGSAASMVADRQTGLHAAAGDPVDLAAKVAWLWDHPAEAGAMGRTARSEFERTYTAERNYELLVEIYALAIRRAGARRTRPRGAINPPAQQCDVSVSSVSNARRV